MAKLVDSAVTVRPFIPKLLPGLIKVETTIGDPEARGVVGRAIATLRQVGEVPESSDGSDLPPIKHVEFHQLAQSLAGIYKKAGAEPPSIGDESVIYAANLAAALCNIKNFDVPEWDTLAPYLELAAKTPEGLTVAREWVVKSATEDTDEGDVPDDEEEGEDLCNCQFSLAYGAKILLNTATLRLKRGHRYGLCGKNGTGKSTLMRAITNGCVHFLLDVTMVQELTFFNNIVKLRVSHRRMRFAPSTLSTISTVARKTLPFSLSSCPTSVSSPTRRKSSRLSPPLVSAMRGSSKPLAVFPVVGR